MNEEATVVQILDEFAKHGHSDKTGKDWSMARVGLSNGESVFVFNPVAVGDVLEAKQNGEYKNWSKVNPKAAADRAQHDEIMKYLKAIYALLGGVKAANGQAPATAPKPAQTAPTQATEHTYPNRAVQAFEKLQSNRDVVAPMPPNDEPNLDDIPY